MRTVEELKKLTRVVSTEVVQAPNDLKDGSGTIYRKLHEFMEANGEGWILLRAPVILEDGSLLAILIQWDE